MIFDSQTAAIYFGCGLSPFVLFWMSGKIRTAFLNRSYQVICRIFGCRIGLCHQCGCIVDSQKHDLATCHISAGSRLSEPEKEK